MFPCTQITCSALLRDCNTGYTQNYAVMEVLFSAPTFFPDTLFLLVLKHIVFQKKEEAKGHLKPPDLMAKFQTPVTGQQSLLLAVDLEHSSHHLNCIFC